MNFLHKATKVVNRINQWMEITRSNVATKINFKMIKMKQKKDKRFIFLD